MRAFLLLAAPLVALLPSPAGAQAVDRLAAVRPDPIVPEVWAESTGDDCYERQTGPRGGAVDTRICDGPRRVPVAGGQNAARAEALGLGTRPSADRLRIGRAPAEWLATLAGAPRTDLLWPVARGLFSRGFGRVRRPEINQLSHDGVDIVAEPGALIRAANDGLVVYADNGVSGYGNLLILLHADGSGTFYGHCRAIYAAPGQLVARGQIVGEVGNTGRPHVEHLHFEWRRGGRALDPMPAFVERPGVREIRPDEETRFAPPPPNVVRPVVTSVSSAPSRRRVHRAGPG